MADCKLFSPITLRGLTLDNRIVLSPMCQCASQDGHASDWHMAHLGTYARSEERRVGKECRL